MMSMMEMLIPSQDTHREMRTGDLAKAEIWQHHKIGAVNFEVQFFSFL